MGAIATVALAASPGIRNLRRAPAAPPPSGEEPAGDLAVGAALSEAPY